MSNAESYQKRRGVSTVRTAAELGRLVRRICAAHADVTVWLFRGGLGSGKTTAVRALLRARGVRQRVFSPTYALVHMYRFGRGCQALHLDAYRVSHRREWSALGLEDFLHRPKTLTLVEWPERMVGYRWGPRGEIKITIVPDGRVVRWKVAGLRRRLGRRRG